MAYREAITRPAEVDYTHKKQSGGSGQFARVKLNFVPADMDEEGATSDFEFVSEIKGGAVPKEYIPGVQKASSLFSCSFAAFVCVKTVVMCVGVVLGLLGSVCWPSYISAVPNTCFEHSQVFCGVHLRSCVHSSNLRPQHFPFRFVAFA